MIISDIAVTRPVFAAVISLLLLAFGLLAFDRLPLREYPDIDPPIVSISTNYQGAAASIVETTITERIEDRISGLEGIKYIQSSSEDGRSRISVEFAVNRDIDAAVNDVRDRVSAIFDDLPEEADVPEIEKVDSNDDVIMWLNLVSDHMDVLELTDYAKRYLQDRFSVLPGVARVRIGGGLEYAMRIWIDRKKLAARGLTTTDIEQALRRENIELPAGGIESVDRQLTARVERNYRSPDDFLKLVLGKSETGYLVRLGDVARVEKSAIEDRTFFRGNELPMVGLGIIKQSKANTLEVAQEVNNQIDRLESMLPEGMHLINSYDTSIFIDNAIKEVYKTLFIAIGLVVLVIYLFLGSLRAMLIPALVVPVSIIATFVLLYPFGFSMNLITLLALVLAIGLVVDDAIVVLENIHRRIELGETPLVAAFYGTRQVGFAVIATTVVLVAVFVPISFLEGNTGRLFSEFALTMAAAVGFSSLIALTLSPMLASKLLKAHDENRMAKGIENFLLKWQRYYANLLKKVLLHPKSVILFFLAISIISAMVFSILPREYAPKEDRGAFFLLVNGPEGASYSFMESYMDEIEKRLMPYVESEEVSRLLVRAPRQFGAISSFNSGIVIVVLNDWGSRRSAWEIMREIQGKLTDLSGVVAFPVMRQGFGGGIQKPVQFVLGGGTYAELVEWRDLLLERINQNNPGLTDIDHDYKETKPQLRISIDQARAADLSVSTEAIGRTLETMLGSRKVTTYIDAGEEYDVILEGERDMQRSITSMENLYVRSERTNVLIPLASLVDITEFSDTSTLNRYNRIRAITIEANLADGYTLGESLEFLENLVRTELPETAVIDYKGESLSFKTSGQSVVLIFILGLVVVFLVLAAQFESFIHPFIIMFSVPLAMVGALLGLWLAGATLNIYTQIGLIMLVGLAAKNGILIVEFINQLRDQGKPFVDAIIEGSSVRLRPILMTGITTVAGSIPLVFATGAGAETRSALGLVIFFGVLTATIFTLFVIPVAYQLLAKNTGSPHDVKRQLDREEVNVKN